MGRPAREHPQRHHIVTLKLRLNVGDRVVGTHRLLEVVEQLVQALVDVAVSVFDKAVGVHDEQASFRQRALGRLERQSA